MKKNKNGEIPTAYKRIYIMSAGGVVPFQVGYQPSSKYQVPVA